MKKEKLSFVLIKATISWCPAATRFQHIEPNVPILLSRTFRTEARDNYIPPILQPASQIHNYEEEARSYYEKSLASLSTNIPEEYNAFQKKYSTENSVVGSRRPVSSVLDQYIEKNKKLERKSVHIG